MRLDKTTYLLFKQIIHCLMIQKEIVAENPLFAVNSLITLYKILHFYLLGKWRPRCARRHVRRHLHQRFQLEWDFCMRSLFCGSQSVVGQGYFGSVRAPSHQAFSGTPIKFNMAPDKEWKYKLLLFLQYSLKNFFVINTGDDRKHLILYLITGNILLQEVSYFYLEKI